MSSITQTPSCRAHLLPARPKAPKAGTGATLLEQRRASPAEPPDCGPGGRRDVRLGHRGGPRPNLRIERYGPRCKVAIAFPEPPRANPHGRGRSKAVHWHEGARQCAGPAPERGPRETGSVRAALRFRRPRNCRGYGSSAGSREGRSLAASPLSYGGADGQLKACTA